MGVHVGLTITAVCLLGAAAAVAPSFHVQSRRVWIDPPPDLNAEPLTSDRGSAVSGPPEAQSWPDEAARQRLQTQIAQSDEAQNANKTGPIQSADEDATELQARKRQAQIAQAEEAQAAAIRQARKKQEAQARERRRIAQQAVEAQRVQPAQPIGYRGTGVRTLISTDGRIVHVQDLPLPFR